MYIFEPLKSSGEKTFDLEQDYKYYYCDFRRIGINLNTEEIPWWEFNTLLEGFFLDEKSTISTVLGYRTYKKPSSSIKTQESNLNKFYMDMKRRYALKMPTKDTKGFEKLWGYLEKKVGDTKERTNET